MSVEVLRAQDPLRSNRYHSHTSPFHRRRNFPATGDGIPNLAVNQKKHSNATQRKTSPSNSNTSSPKPEKKKIKKSPKSPQVSGVATATSPPVVGQVTILKRGESLASISRSSRSENPNPNFLNGLTTTSVADVYAGSGFVISPSPQSLPLPSFFGKKESFHDASENLRRLLGLDVFIN